MIITRRSITMVSKVLGNGNHAKMLMHAYPRASVYHFGGPLGACDTLITDQRASIGSWP